MKKRDPCVGISLKKKKKKKLTHFDGTYPYPWWEKMWKSGSSFQGNVTLWWEILYFSIKKYIRNSGKCNYLPGKNTFFPDLPIPTLHNFAQSLIYSKRISTLNRGPIRPLKLDSVFSVTFLSPHNEATLSLFIIFISHQYQPFCMYIKDLNPTWQLFTTLSLIVYIFLILFSSTYLWKCVSL